MANLQKESVRAGIIFKIVEMGFTAREYELDGGMKSVMVSAEDIGRDDEGNDVQAADYYGEFRDGLPWINPKLEEYADKLGCYWEWDSPGAIVLAD